MVGYTGNIFFCFFFCPSVRLFPAKAAHSTTDQPRPKRLVRGTCLHRWLGQLVHTHNTVRERVTGGRRADLYAPHATCSKSNKQQQICFLLFLSFFPSPLFTFIFSSSFLIIYLFVCFVFHSVYTPSSSKDMVDIYMCVCARARERETPQSV